MSRDELYAVRQQIPTIRISTSSSKTSDFRLAGQRLMLVVYSSSRYSGPIGTGGPFLQVGKTGCSLKVRELEWLTRLAASCDCPGNRGQTERSPFFDKWKSVNIPSVASFPFLYLCA